MNRRLALYALAPLAIPFALGGIALTAGANEPASVLDVRAAMQQGINAATMEIWDVGNNAMGDDGGIDPAQMTPENWDRLAAAAEVLRGVALDMHGAQTIIAASPDNMPTGDEPGAVPMEDVQRFIDADPQGFRDAALVLADHAGLLVGAAQSRDARVAGDLVAQLDQVCEVCHSQFWYPEPPVLAGR